MTTIHDIAAGIVARFPNEGVSTSKLQALTYIAQGWSLALTGDPLFNEQFTALPGCPFSADLRSRYDGRYTIGSWDAGNIDAITVKQRVILDSITAQYGALSGTHLNNLIAVPGSPWETCVTEQQEKIPTNLLKVWFTEQLIGSPAFADEVARAASSNYESQEQLIEAIRNTTTVPVELIAERLDQPVEKVRSVLAGEYDMTLTELRYLANAAEVTIQYTVTLNYTPKEDR